MPKVAGKKFPYTVAGRASAKRYAKSTGKRMTEDKKKKKKKGGY